MMNFKKLAGLLAVVLLAGSVKLAHAVNYGNVSLQVTIGDVSNMNIALRLQNQTITNEVQTATTTFGTGAVAFGASTVTLTGVDIVNRSVGIALKYGLSGFDSGVGVPGNNGYWVVGSTSAPNQFAIMARFNATKPLVGDFNLTSDNIYRPDTTDTHVSTAACLTTGGAAPYNMFPSCEYIPTGSNSYADTIYVRDLLGGSHFVGGEDALSVPPSVPVNDPTGSFRTVWFRLDAPTLTTVGGIGTRTLTVGVMGNLP
jgi:hypothetical protein